MNPRRGTELSDYLDVTRTRQDGRAWYVECVKCHRIFDLYDEEDENEVGDHICDGSRGVAIRKVEQ